MTGWLGSSTNSTSSPTISLKHFSQYEYLPITVTDTHTDSQSQTPTLSHSMSNTAIQSHSVHSSSPTSSVTQLSTPAALSLSQLTHVSFPHRRSSPLLNPNVHLFLFHSLILLNDIMIMIVLVSVLVSVRVSVLVIVLVSVL